MKENTIKKINAASWSAVLILFINMICNVAFFAIWLDGRDEVGLAEYIDPFWCLIRILIFVMISVFIIAINKTVNENKAGE